MVVIEIMVAIAVCVAIGFAIIAAILHAKLRGKKKTVLLLENALSGQKRIHEMMVEYKSKPTKELCKVIQKAIKNWNSQFSKVTGHTMPNITCP